MCLLESCTISSFTDDLKSAFICLIREFLRRNISQFYSFSQSYHLNLLTNRLFQSLTERENPNLGLLCTLIKSTSPDIDRNNFCDNPCRIRTPTFPYVLTRAFASVDGKNSCWAPTARALSLVENRCFNSAPRAVLLRGLTTVKHEAFKVSSLSLHIQNVIYAALCVCVCL